MKHAEYADKEKEEIAERIIEIFGIMPDREHKDRYYTSWGSKTKIGIYATFMRIADDIRSGKEIK
jgi:hypothetical protein